MKILSAEECPQGSPRWWEERLGRPTASSFNRIMTPKKRQFSKGAARYAADLASQIAFLAGGGTWGGPTCFSEGLSKPPNPWMESGSDREAEVRRWYEFDQEVTVKEVGFCLSDCGRYGCSPDGLVYRGIEAPQLWKGLELKSPLLKTQAVYALLDDVPLEYRNQVHGGLIVSGLKSWDFLSHRDALPKLLVPVERSAYTDDLEQCLEMFLKLYDQTLQKLLGIDLAEAMDRYHKETPCDLPSGPFVA